MSFSHFFPSQKEGKSTHHIADNDREAQNCCCWRERKKAPTKHTRACKTVIGPFVPKHARRDDGTPSACVHHHKQVLRSLPARLLNGFRANWEAISEIIAILPLASYSYWYSSISSAINHCCMKSDSV